VGVGCAGGAAAAPGSLSSEMRPSPRLSCAVAAATLAVGVAPAFGGTFLSKARARSVAVTVTAQTCRVVGWCQGYEVVPASRCHRQRPTIVRCSIAFITADRRRCRGLVVVSRARTGRLERAMAVPMYCGTTPVAL
jgi:hypothetical protein